MGNFNHLENGFKPITVCVDEKKFDTHSFFMSKNQDYRNYTDNVNYEANQDYFRENKMLSIGPSTFVISELNSKNKYTTGLCDCTSIIVSGVDKETGRNISILTHEDSQRLFKEPITEFFIKNLSKRIQEILERSKIRSIDAIILGGNTFKGNTMVGYTKDYYDNYKKSIELITQIIREKLNFEPTVTTGPKEDRGSTNVYFDNDKRRAYLFIPEQKNTINYNDFQPKDIDTQIERIKKEKE